MINRLSDTVGGVNHFLSGVRHALVEERHFALVEAVAFAPPTQARSQSTDKEFDVGFRRALLLG
jgi:hypothetical protein